MNGKKSGLSLPLLIASTIVAPGAFAQSLSAGLGATKLDGLTVFANCQNQSTGYREHLIADRIEAKLAQSPALTPPMRDAWFAEIKALHAVTPENGKYNAPDPKDSQRYFLGLTDKEQQAINSMAVRHSQEINLECEHKYGGMTRYSPGSDQSGQKRYEDEMRAKLNAMQVIDIATIPITALQSPFPKTPEQQAAERKAQQETRRAQQKAAASAASQGIVAKATACQQKLAGLRWNIMADHMQKNLDAATGLSGKDKADYQADIKSMRDAAASGAQMPAAVDPANPMRAMMRVAPQDQIAITTEFSTQYAAKMAACQSQ
jgi:hypothetical protein